MANEKAEETTTTVDKAEKPVNTDMTGFDLTDPGMADAAIPATSKSESDSGPGATAEAEDTQVEFDPELLARAKSVGLSIAEAKELGSPGSLTKVVEAAERLLAERSPRGHDTSESNPESPAKQPERRKLKLDPATLGEETAAILQQLDEQHAEELAVMRSENAALRQRIEQNLDAAREERITTYFEAQTDFQDIIDPDHPRNRSRVTDKMAVLKAGYEAMKRKVPGERELFHEAFASEFGDKQAAVARRKLTTSLERREKSLTARADQRNTPADPYQAAVQAVAEAQAQMRQGVPADV